MRTAPVALAFAGVAITEAQQCTTATGVSVGAGFIKELKGVASAAACCTECFDFGYGCTGFTFDTSGTGDCFLKDNTSGSTPTANRTSGAPGAGPRPPTPADNRTVATRACLAPHDKYPFCDPSLTLDARLDDLIGRLNDTEIPPLLTAREGGGGSPGPPGNISRLGLPEYDWGANCIHGVQTTCGRNSAGEIMCPTSFPNPNALGATFNRSLWREMGSIIGVELRSLWLQGATEASTWSGRPHAGLDCWSPNVNIARDPRWGRNQEVPSEDPFINGVFGTAYTKGLQEGEDPRFLQAIVTLKHWDAYSLEDADGRTRHDFDAIISNFTLADTYWPAFKASVQEGKAHGVMCSYNSVNGVPTCANAFLDHVLRDEWGFDGYITSDTGAVADIYKNHHYSPTAEAATCAALRDGGCDLDSGSVYSPHLLPALAQGLCDMSDVKQALRRTLGLRFRLGLFDPIEDQPYWHVSKDAVNTTASQETNKRAARESMVLLQNDGTLPLPKGKTIAVVGPHAKANAALVGNYLGQLCPDRVGSYTCIQTPFDAIAALNSPGAVTYSAGCDVTKAITGGVDAAVAACKAADSCVLALGIDEAVEGESHDRTEIDLPAPQHELAAAVLALKKPTAIFLLNGGMVGIEAEKASGAPIIEAFYPGFWGAEAIATTLFGDNENLGGKMPITTYPTSYLAQPSINMSNMAMEPVDGGPGRS